MTIYEISVFGQDFENVKSEGGWQVALRTTSYEEAEKALAEWLEKLGWDDVVWDWSSAIAEVFEPDFDKEPADIDSDFGFDPYEGCYTYDC